MEVYVNLHPEYDYANVMVCGFVKELKEYVKLVDWLMWDYPSGKGRPFIRVHGENHIEKVAVLLQRLMDDDVDIYVRNERSDEWVNYKAERIYADEELIAIEQKRDKEPERWKWAKEDLQKANKYIAARLEKGIEPEDLLLEMKKDAEAQLQELEDDEKDRLYSISKIWKN